MSELSYLEKLLDGAEVEWVALNKLATFLKGKSLPKEKITPDGNRYCIHYGELFTHYGPIIDKVCSKTNQAINESILSEKNDVLMPTSDVTPRGLATASCIQESGVILGGDILIIRCSGVDGRYLSNFIINNKKKILQMVKGSTVYHLYAKDIGKLLIPIPCPNNPEKSLAIQSEIVRILDKFTALTAELTAELSMRKKQYNYYRDQLLSFKEGEVEWKTLGEVAQYSKTRISFELLDERNYVGVDNLLQNRAGKSLSNHVPTSGKLTEFIPNDILIGNIRPYLKKIWQADCIGGTNGDVLVIRCIDSSINTRYLYQILADDKFFEYNMQHAKGAKMPRGSKEDIMKYPIPVPPLTLQARIVEILNKFDTLTNSITEGLPREIELRQKQYEYYRDLLFSFPKPETVSN
ncbi:type I restriction-modification enzyme S subunit [Escherichia coli]|uniref:restriction endonuclease subunit S n=1 Tax=Escherichia coli TaxID=562 RepID=UPI000DA5B712|nr:restriction endonuclease subunit S [Escherichia coli]SQT38808.1 type I restriction-modification enzyme S subunit [Escherichia coli]SQT52466.1 type I restriction-modification enzyme S subunit [Escherichia coli]SQT54299.1 type I restriction-modification enzyme S subunit [Escherichia coli]SQU03493.1 type I restriction-modification enzyme S subunit [Escherichia coli]SQU20183.1 type I restriction-modification enzyme S subunit [Escherichia coli]